MATTNSVTLTFGYENSDATRRYKFDDVSSSVLSGIVTQCKAINGSLSAGTAGGLSTFFLDDDGNHFASIIAAQSDETEVTIINLNE